MKKLLLIGGVIVVIFAAIFILSKQAETKKLKDNPYGTEDLHPSTINLLGNENYSNITLPEDVFKKIESGDSVTVYYFHPQCQYCMEMTPRLMPIAKDVGVSIPQYNLLEFGELVKTPPYSINSWPVLVHYDNGEEVERMEGLQSEEHIRNFLTKFEH